MHILAISYRNLHVDPRHRRLVEFFGGDLENSIHRLSVTTESVSVPSRVTRLRVPSLGVRALTLFFSTPAKRYFKVVEKPLTIALEKVSSPDLILISDIDVLPSLGLLRSRFPKANFVVDLYENYLDFRETNSLGRYYLHVLKEGLAQLKDSDIVCAPEYNTASWYEEYLGHPVLTVPNARPKNEFTTASNLAHSTHGDLKLVHTGYLFENRGINTYVNALRLASSNLSLTIFTPSSLWRRLRVRALNLGLVLRRKLSIRRAVPYKQLVSKLAHFDYGLCLIEGENANAKYALPNKFFDYVAAGIPMVLGTGPVLTQFADKLGQDSLTQSDSHQLAYLLSQLDQEKLETMRTELARTRDALSCDESFRRLYEQIQAI